MKTKTEEKALLAFRKWTIKAKKVKTLADIKKILDGMTEEELKSKAFIFDYGAGDVEQFTSFVKVGDNPDLDSEISEHPKGFKYYLFSGANIKRHK